MAKKRVRLSEEASKQLLEKLKSVAKVYNSSQGLVVKWADVERLINKITEKKEVDEQA